MTIHSDSERRIEARRSWRISRSAKRQIATSLIHVWSKRLFSSARNGNLNQKEVKNRMADAVARQPSIEEIEAVIPHLTADELERLSSAVVKDAGRRLRKKRA